MLVVGLILGAVVVSGATAPELLKREATTAIKGPHCLNPEIYARDTNATDCYPTLSTNPDGSCPVSAFQQCASYCQKNVSWNFGPEVPFLRSGCGQNDSCTITATQSISWTNAYSFNVGGTLKKRALEERNTMDILKSAFNFGSTWSWSETVTNSTAIAHVRPNQELNNCGYWTFVPYYITSCGTLSTGEPYTSWDPTSGALPPRALGQGESCVNVTTTDDWCQTVTYLDEDGNAGGETIFVATSCNGKWPLSFCKQDPIYLIPGVSSNATIYTDYVIAHENGDITQPLESTSEYLCTTGQRPFNEDNEQPN